MTLTGIEYDSLTTKFFTWKEAANPCLTLEVQVDITIRMSREHYLLLFL